MHEPQRILLIRLSHLGDVVLTLPLFHALREAFPAAEIAWVTQPEFAGLLEGLPGLARVLRFGRREGAGAWLRLREDSVTFRPDLVVDAQGNLKSAMAALCSGAARRVGAHRRDWREPLGAWAMNERAPAAVSGVGGGETHAFERVRALAAHLLGQSPQEVELRRDPGLTAVELARGRATLAELLAGRPGAPVCVNLAPPGDVRSWTRAGFEELLLRLGAEGRPVLALSGPAEASLGAEIAAAVPGVSHWVGQRGLRELAAVLTAAAERGGRFAGCDSGPMHLAAACGLPVVLLAGPQSHLRTGPWPLASAGAGAPHAVVRAEPQPACAPCLDRRCSHPAGPVCMSALEARQVLRALG